jgi:hypothetical protein
VNPNNKDAIINFCQSRFPDLKANGRSNDYCMRVRSASRGAHSAGCASLPTNIVDLILRILDNRAILGFIYIRAL